MKRRRALRGQVDARRSHRTRQRLAAPRDGIGRDERMVRTTGAGEGGRGLRGDLYLGDPSGAGFGRAPLAHPRRRLAGALPAGPQRGAMVS